MNWIVGIPLVIGVLIGLSSLAWFVNLALIGNGVVGLIVLQALAVAATLAWAKQLQFERVERPPASALNISILILLIFNLGLFVAGSIFHPFGDWDALMIWNLHARFLHRLANDWHAMFVPALFWSHPDYPLLLPGFLATIWRGMGESAAAPIASALFFFLGTVALLFGGSKNSGLATCLLLTTPAFCFMGANQCADIPIGFYLLSSLVLLLFHETNKNNALLFGSGLMIGLAAWTKNEGLLFVIALLVARSMVLIRAEGVREAARQLLWMSAGLAAPLAVSIYFKAKISPPSDIVLGLQDGGLLRRITNPARWLLIVEQFVVVFVTFGFWLLSPIPLLIAVMAFQKNQPRLSPAAATTALTIAFVLAGFFAVYLAMAEDIGALAQRLFFALGRLLLQLWPAMLFLMIPYFGRADSIHKS
jgi:hypothetical protein